MALWKWLKKVRLLMRNNAEPANCRVNFLKNSKLVVASSAYFRKKMECPISL